MNIFSRLRSRKPNSPIESAAEAVLVESLEHRMLLSAVSPLWGAQRPAIVSAPLNVDFVKRTSDAGAGTSVSTEHSYQRGTVTETIKGYWEINIGPFKFGEETTVTTEFEPEAPAGVPAQDQTADGSDDPFGECYPGDEGDDGGGDEGGGGDDDDDDDGGEGDTGESEG